MDTRYTNEHHEFPDFRECQTAGGRMIGQLRGSKRKQTDHLTILILFSRADGENQSYGQEFHARLTSFSDISSSIYASTGKSTRRPTRRHVDFTISPTPVRNTHLITFLYLFTFFVLPFSFFRR